MGPQPLQIKQNTRSFKTSALNSLQLFPLRASSTVLGKHVANPQGEGRGAWGEGCPRRRPPLQPPAPARRVGRAWATPGPSLLPCAAHMIFVTRGEVVLYCFRISEGNFCAPTGDSACQLLTGAEAAAAPPSPFPGRSRSPLGRAQTPAAAASALTSLRGLGKRMPEAAGRHLGKGR